MLSQVIKLVNTVKSSALNTRLFRRFCKQMDADHYDLLYHTEVRWLSKGNVLKRVFTLRNELRDFFVQQKKEDLVKFLHEDVVSLAYFVDIFSRLNELNNESFLARTRQNNRQFYRRTFNISGEIWTLGKKDDNGPNGNVSYLE